MLCDELLIALGPPHVPPILPELEDSWTAETNDDRCEALESADGSNSFRVHYPSPTFAEGKALLCIKTHADSVSSPIHSALKGSRPELEYIRFTLINPGNHGKTHMPIAATKNHINIAEADEHGLINGSKPTPGQSSPALTPRINSFCFRMTLSRQNEASNVVWSVVTPCREQA